MVLNLRPNNTEDLNDFFTEKVMAMSNEPLRLGTHFEVVKSAVVNNVWYGAVKNTVTKQDKEESVVSAVIIPFKWLGTQGDLGSIGYRILFESTAPMLFDCPSEVLDELSPTSESLAELWREVCRTPEWERSDKLKELLLG